ncbi:hypothetical protein ACWERF_19120 [Streptomyces griseoluteus]
MERIVVVGAGHLGSVVVRGLVDGVPQAQVVVVEPSAERRASLDGRAEVTATHEPRPDGPLVLAVPPQAFGSFEGDGGADGARGWIGRPAPDTARPGEGLRLRRAGRTGKSGGEGLGPPAG